VAGLIDKVRQDEDERIVRLFLTNKAKELEPLVADVQHRIACHAKLTPEQFKKLLSQLGELNKTLSGPAAEPLSATGS
jgi:DNA-binding MarR family transcriptional regulator